MELFAAFPCSHFRPGCDSAASRQVIISHAKLSKLSIDSVMSPEK